MPLIEDELHAPPVSSSGIALFEDELRNPPIPSSRTTLLGMESLGEDRIKKKKVRKIYFTRSFFFLRLGENPHQKQ